MSKLISHSIIGSSHSPSLKSSNFEESISEKLNLSSFQLNIIVNKAELATNISIINCNPFVTFTYSSNSVSTQTKYSTLTPVYNEELLLPIFSSSSKSLLIGFHLEKLKEKDEFLYQISIPFHKITQMSGSWRWFHIYTGEFDSNYFGKVLIKFITNENSKPIGASFPFVGKVLYPTTLKYTVWFELVEIAGFGVNDNIKVSIELGTQIFWSTTAKVQNQRWVWGKYSVMPEIIVELEEVNQLPNFIIKVYKDPEKLCIGSLSKLAQEIVEKGSRPIEPIWEEFNSENPSAPFLGFCLSRVNIVPIGELQYFRPKKFEIISSLFEVRAVIFQARNIHLCDIGGLADPFITVSVNGVSKKTQIQRQCLNPQWNEILTWKIDLFSQKPLKNLIQIDLWEWNDPPQKSIIKAKSLIDYNLISKENVGKPVWYTLESKSTTHPPKVLASFVSYKLQQIKQVIPQLKINSLINFVNYQMNVSIIGGRKIGLYNQQQNKVFFKVSIVNSQPIMTRVIKVVNTNNFNVFETLKSTIKAPTLRKYAPSLVISLLQYSIDKREILLGSTSILLDNYLPFDEDEDNRVLEENDEEILADATQITENEEEKLESDKSKGYVKKSKERKEINGSFEEVFGVSLPFDCFWLERLESEGNVVKSGMVKFKIKICSDNSELNDEDFKPTDKITVLYAKLSVYSVTGLGENQEGVFLWIKSFSENNDHKYEDSIYTGETAEILTTYTVKLNLPNDSFLLFELHKKLNQKNTCIWTYELDIEQRWFNKKFKVFKSSKQNLPPIETLHSDLDPSISFKVSIDLLTEENYKSAPPDIILGKVSNTYELRLIIWKLKNLDSSEKDLKIKGFFKDQRQGALETDTHFSAAETAEFNWRFKFLVSTPVKNSVFVIEVMNVRTNQIYGKCEIDLSDYFEDVFQSYEIIFLSKMWVKLENDENENGVILVEASMLTEEEAKNQPVGYGREKPNKHPELMMPSNGRKFEDLINEIELIKKEEKRKKALYKRCIGFWLVVLIAIAIPVAVYSIV